ncbi:MAG: hypothetical protein O2900_14730 [Proteobacteria bacterium]|nr:hypothetical protein [Pseudomonadota bacterium]
MAAVVAELNTLLRIKCWTCFPNKCEQLALNRTDNSARDQAYSIGWPW